MSDDLVKRIEYPHAAIVATSYWRYSRVGMVPVVVDFMSLYCVDYYITEAYRQDREYESTFR